LPFAITRRAITRRASKISRKVSVTISNRTANSWGDLARRLARFLVESGGATPEG
jgi:hypothetical protein